MKIIKWIAIGIGIILLVAVVGFIVWSLNPAPALPDALSALIEDQQVATQNSPWLVFEPAQENPTTGLIIYPGGRVDARAYAPAARKIAEQGYLVVIVPMPLNLAVFGVSKAQAVIEAYPEIQHWVIGGHSVGGSMAASFADKNPDLIDGVVFWASYPAGSDDLSDQKIKTVSIYGTRDGLASLADIQASRPLLPEDTRWVAIEGGNHAQFGWYGEQSGDNSATISRQEQQDQLIQATLALLAQVEGDH